MPVWGEIESYSGCKTGTTMSFPSYQAHSATPVLRFITFREPAGTRTQGPRLKRAGEYCTLSLYFTRGSVSFQAVGRIAKNCHEFPVNNTI